jgi:hypothetical protein
MHSSMNNRPGSAGTPVDLEEPLAAVEAQLAALGLALRTNDSDGIDRHASELHRALARAVDRFTLAARAGAIPLPLRNRLATASGEMAAQRESLARATAALDRALDVLLPREASSVYSALGASDRAVKTGMMQA